MNVLLLILLIFFAITDRGQTEECNQRKTEYGNVCVCNATFCDTVPKINVPSGTYQIFTTTSEKLGFASQSALLSKISQQRGAKNTLKVVKDTTKQSIIGFGGAFTDSAGINIRSLSESAKDNLLSSYFGEDGISYSLCRVPIGGADFSPRKYSYNDQENDVNLTTFALQEEDFNYKIPYIKEALELTKNKLKLFSSAWSAPIWMKTNHDWAGIGQLKKEYYQVWANYYIRFFEEYAKNGVTFWGVTTQNEPIDGYVPGKVNSLGWTSSQMAKWISENFGPTVRNSTFSDLKVLAHDDSRATLPWLPKLLENDKTIKYIDGVAVHWYEDKILPSSWLKYTKSSKKDLFLIGTEACNGFLHMFGLDEAVKLGSWNRGEKYVNSILENMQYGAGGWVDWNMVLNEEGGPCSIANFVDSPIIVNNTNGEFYKQPMFYVLGHFSKFLTPDSVVVETEINTEIEGLKSVAVLRPDNLTAVILFNENSNGTDVEIISENVNINVHIEGKSINTVLF